MQLKKKYMYHIIQNMSICTQNSSKYKENNPCIFCKHMANITADISYKIILQFAIISVWFLMLCEQLCSCNLTSINPYFKKQITLL